MRSSILRFLLLIMICNLCIPYPFTAAQTEPETHTVIVQNNSFSPSNLQVNIGDIIQFEWADGALGHNVIQTSSSSSIEAMENGFSSGDPVSAPFSYIIPEEYLTGNITLYYICEPHATSGMTGSITVGSGSGSSDTLFSSIILIGFSFVILISIRRKKLRS